MAARQHGDNGNKLQRLPQGHAQTNRAYASIHGLGTLATKSGTMMKTGPIGFSSTGRYSGLSMIYNRRYREEQKGGGDSTICIFPANPDRL